MLKLACSTVLTMVLMASPTTTPDTDYALTVKGGVTLTSTGAARYGIVRGDEQNPPFFSLTLGSQDGNGALVLSRAQPEVPLAGTYAIQTWDLRGSGRKGFQALFIAGTTAQPLGVFWGESGTVTIHHTSPQRIDGVFTIHARGFRAEDPDREEVKVTIHGTFTANGEQVVAQVTGIEPRQSL